MKEIEISIATKQDIPILADIFWSHINANHEYISHGEVQMGVGVAKINSNGDICTFPAENGKEMWLQYISSKLDNQSFAAVLKAESKSEDQNLIAGFCVVEIDEDGSSPYGMLCDLLVREQYRSLGIGNLLMHEALSWFKKHEISDIYLESGKNNHDAHSFFQKRGFQHISEIFKLKTD